MRANSKLRNSVRLLGASGLVLAAALLGQSAFAQSTIIGSRHDLSSGSATTEAKVLAGTNEVCVFCHTPHGASASGPLWNRGAAAGPFVLYTSTSMDGTAIAPGAGSSGLCLSCHDGATALDLLINAPGSGGYNAGGLSAGYTWVVGTTTGNLMKAGIANLGTDLSNDHPVGNPYCGGASGTVCKDPDFKTANLVKDGVAPQTNPTAAAGQNWWVDIVTPTTTRVKGDLPLYARSFSGTFYPAVECATCHEPHGSGNTMFLRMANTSSNLCTACHNK